FVAGCLRKQETPAQHRVCPGADRGKQAATGGARPGAARAALRRAARDRGGPGAAQGLPHEGVAAGERAPGGAPVASRRPEGAVEACLPVAAEACPPTAVVEACCPPTAAEAADRRTAAEAGGSTKGPMTTRPGVEAPPPSAPC